MLFVPNGDRYPKPDLAPARDRLAMVAAGEPIDALVPPRVAELIAARGLYRSGAAR